MLGFPYLKASLLLESPSSHFVSPKQQQDTVASSCVSSMEIPTLLESNGMLLSLCPVWLTGDETTAPNRHCSVIHLPATPSPVQRPLLASTTVAPKAQTYPRGFPASASLAGSQEANNSLFPAPPWCNCSEIAESDPTYCWM